MWRERGNRRKNKISILYEVIMNKKKKFKESYKYYLEHVNTNTYTNTHKDYDEKHKKEILEFQQNDPNLKYRTDWYENHIVTSVTICEMME